MSKMTLAQKVYALTQSDDAADAIRYASHATPPFTDDDDDQHEHEMDLVDWGVTYGFALAVARLEDPFEPIESVALRAQQAAWRVQLVSNHGFRRACQKPTDEDYAAVRYEFDPKVMA